MLECSSGINNSKCVYFSDFVVNSTCVYDCFGLLDCECVKNCIFCKGIKCKEYMIFNKKVSKEGFRQILGKLRVNVNFILNKNKVIKDANMSVFIPRLPNYNEKLFNEIEKTMAQTFDKGKTQV